MNARPASRGVWRALLLVVVGVLAASAWLGPLGGALPLALLRVPVAARYPDAPSVAPAALAAALARPEPARPVLLDVRSAAEFAVSHLRGARRVDAEGASTAALALPAARPVVVYCAVGLRSAALVARLRAAGHRDARNLEGGLFRWAREGRPMYRGVAPAQRVHPYDGAWGLFLPRRLRAPRD